MLRINKKIIKPILLAFVLLPRILLSSREASGAYVYDNVAFMRMFFNESHLPLDSPVARNLGAAHHPASEIMQLTIAKICGLPPEMLHTLPISGIILTLTYYILCKRLFGSLVASFMAILVSYEVSISIATYSVFPGAWTFALFPLFLMTYLEIFDGRKRREIFILYLIVVSSNFYYYSGILWMITYSLFINFMILFFPKMLAKNVQSKKGLSLSACISFVIIFFAFNKAVYEVFLTLVSISGGKGIEDFNRYLSRLQTLLPSIGFKAEEGYLHPSNPLISWLGFIYLLVLLTPIGVSVIMSLGKFLRAQLLAAKKLTSITTDSSRFLYLKWSLMVIGVLEIFVYTLCGQFSTRWILYAFPVVTMISLRELKVRSSFKIAILCILVFLSVSRFGLSFIEGWGLEPHSKFAEIEPSARWFFDKSVQGSVVLADHHTNGRYLIVGASYGILLKQLFYDSSVYEKLVNATLSLTNVCDYVVMDLKAINKGTISMRWRVYEPLQNYLSEINRKVSINRIYNDGNVLILKPIP